MNKKYVVTCLLFCSFFVYFIKAMETQTISQSEEQNYERGNWYEKLQWWRKAGPEYGAIKQLIKKVRQDGQLLNQVSKVFTTEIEKFDTQFHISSTQLTKAISNKITEFKQKESDEEEQVILLKKLELLQEQNNTAQVWFKYADHAINSTLEQQIGKAEAFQEEALDSLDKLEATYNDQNARYLYEVIQTSKENIQAILEYINGPLKAYIERAQGEFSRAIGEVTIILQDLEKQGILLRNLTSEEQERQIQAQKKEQKIQDHTQNNTIKSKKQSKESSSWWQRIKSFFGF